MEEFKVKDIIFSFRHLYLDNNKKINKRLKKHISIKSPLIDDIKLYVTSDSTRNRRVQIKNMFKKGSIGSLLSKMNEVLDRNTDLEMPSSIKCNEDGEYYIDSKYNIKLKDQRIAKDMECMFKEEFYEKMPLNITIPGMVITFSETDITFRTNDYIVWYSSLGDVILSYSEKDICMEDILNTSVSVEDFDDYHREILKKEKKSVDPEEAEFNSNPGDFTIKERENCYTLKYIKKSKVNRYI